MLWREKCASHFPPIILESTTYTGIITTALTRLRFHTFHQRKNECLLQCTKQFSKRVNYLNYRPIHKYLFIFGKISHKNVCVCVFVVLGIQHAMRVALWSASLYSFFPNYLLKGCSSKKMIVHKLCVSNFSKTFAC
jgi:hypothetical protein